MKIKAKVKLKYKFNSYAGYYLKLYIKFKHPNNIFPTSLHKVIAADWWVGEENGYIDRDHYEKCVLSFINNEDECMSNRVINMVKEYHEEKNNKKSDDKFTDKIYYLLKNDNKEIEIEVELED